jgi:hypothetical protein
MKRCSARSETAQITVSRVATYLISELIDECQNLNCLWDEATVTNRQFRQSSVPPFRFHAVTNGPAIVAMPRLLRNALDVSLHSSPTPCLSLERPTKECQRPPLYGFQSLLYSLGSQSDLNTGRIIKAATMVMAYFISFSFKPGEVESATAVRDITQVCVWFCRSNGLVVTVFQLKRFASSDVMKKKWPCLQQKPRKPTRGHEVSPTEAKNCTSSIICRIEFSRQMGQVIFLAIIDQPHCARQCLLGDSGAYSPRVAPTAGVRLRLGSPAPINPWREASLHGRILAAALSMQSKEQRARRA